MSKSSQKSIISNLPLNLCSVTGNTFDRSYTPLILRVQDNDINVQFFLEKNCDDVLIDPDPKLISDLINGNKLLPESLRAYPVSDLKDKIVNAYQARFISVLNFMLKTKNGVIGRRAIERSIFGYYNQAPVAILATLDASEKILENFKFKQRNIKIIKNFSQQILQTVSGREKISYFCILDTDIGHIFLNDYYKYEQLKY